MPKEAKIPSTLIECVEAYAEGGYATFATSDKKPAHGIKWKGMKVDTAPNRMKYPYGEFGARLKADDLVIDLDPRNMKGRQVWSELKQRVSILADIEKQATIVRTGSGGIHLYLRKPPSFNIRKNLPEFPGIDFLSLGAYVIGAGSIVEGKGYQFLTAPFIPTEAPSGLLNLIRKEVVDLGKVLHQGFSDSQDNIDRFVEYLDKHAPIAIEGENGDATTFKVACRGRDYNLSMSKTAELMAKYYNPKCKPMWELADLNRKVSNAYNYNQAPPGTRDPRVALPDMKGVTDPKEWMKDLEYTKNNALRLSFKNAVTLLKNDPSVAGKFRYNAFNERLEIRSDVPWSNNRINRYNAVDDREVECIRLHFSHTHHVEFSTATMWKAVDIVAAGNIFHPITDVLDTYKWDGKMRIDSWLIDYCGAADTELNRQIGRKVLCGMVARVYNPGCKFDYVLVLEGAQGIGKSTTCEILGGDWFGDAPIDPKDKDVIPYIHSKWVIELSEMITTRKTEADRMKNFLSRREDDVRLPYARARQRFPRQCIFIGTINPDDVGYLNDTTGNRRFWPVFCTEFDLEGLKRDREQLLAEAVAVHKAGEALVLPHALIRESEEEAMKRLADDPWQNVLEEWGAANPDIGETSTQHVYRYVFNGNVQHMHTGHQRRIAQALKNLGWVRVKTADGMKYRRPVKVEGDENN